jgi:hypothetical protein
VAEQRVAAAEDRAAEAVADRMAVAGIGNRSFILFLVARKLWKWREAICGERN